MIAYLIILAFFSGAFELLHTGHPLLAFVLFLLLLSSIKVKGDS